MAAIEGTALLGGVLYFTGYWYAYAYLSAFGISVRTFNFSTQSILMFAYPVLREQYPWFLALIGLFTTFQGLRHLDCLAPALGSKAFMSSSPLWPAYRAIHRIWRLLSPLTFTWMLMLIACLSLLQWLALNTARTDANKLREIVSQGTGHHLTIVAASSTSPSMLAEINTLNAAGRDERLARIAEDSDQLYLLQEGKPITIPGLPMEIAAGTVYEIRKSNLFLVQSDDFPTTAYP